MELTPVSRKYVDVLITGTGSNGSAIPIASAEAALTEERSVPHAGTAWTPVTVTAGVARILLCGPDADPVTGGLVVSNRADLWIRVDNAPEVLPAKVGTVTVQN